MSAPLPETRRAYALPPQGTVLFIVGMRINRLAAVHRWLPVMIAIPRMLVELARNRDLGMIGTPRTLVSGRLIMVQQYWSSYEALERYAHDAGHSGESQHQRP